MLKFRPGDIIIRKYNSPHLLISKVVSCNNNALVYRNWLLLFGEFSNKKGAAPLDELELFRHPKQSDLLQLAKQLPPLEMIKVVKQIRQ